MRIATWNVERLRHKKELSEIIRQCNQVAADILVLTETDRRVRPDYKFCFETPELTAVRPRYYKPTENRVSIFTNYPCVRQYETYDSHTSLCVELETELGNLLIYGTIIGIEGNRRASFREDLLKQVEDFERLSVTGKNLCICGDYNLSFCDNYYYTTFGRDTILRSFQENDIRLLTADQTWCIDHIAVSEQFARGRGFHVEEWNLDKTLSDHKGIYIDIFP